LIPGCATLGFIAMPQAVAIHGNQLDSDPNFFDPNKNLSDL